MFHSYIVLENKIMVTTERINENLEKCPRFISCSRNLCPLDLELHLRSGGKQDMCHWSREPKRVKVGDKEFVSGGTVMPDALLNFVPESNLRWLNQSSQKRWHKLKILENIAKSKSIKNEK